MSAGVRGARRDLDRDLVGPVRLVPYGQAVVR
jgi:hypothetical protein